MSKGFLGLIFPDDREAYLYHQIHPAKMGTDVGATIVSLVFFWRHEFLSALLIAFIPPIIASAILMRRADIKRLKESRFGRHIAHRMTPFRELLRLLTFFLVSYAAWEHIGWLIAAGWLFVILLWAA